MDVTYRLRQERDQLFKAIERINARQLDLRPRPRKAQEDLRLRGVRTARPAFGTYEYVGAFARSTTAQISPR